MALQRFFNTLGLTAAALLLVGCAAGMKVPVKDPTPSTTPYTKTGKPTPTAIYFSDARPADNKAAMTNGFLGITVVDAASTKALDPQAYFSGNVVKEMVARGLPVTAATVPGPNAVAFKRIFIESRRVSAFSPFETFTMVSAHVSTPSGNQRIASFVKRGKVPVWSFDEIVDPTFNEPLNIATKEIAAKLGRILYGAKLSDAQVDALIAKTSAPKIDPRDVYELGFSFNPRAVPHLLKLAGQEGGDTTHAAVSSLGILRAPEALNLLITKASNPKDDWEDRATALKALGDLGTPPAQDFLKKEMARVNTLTDAESVRTKTLLAMYLN